MALRIIDGLIRKLESKTEHAVFFDFEFWAESEVETHGLLCLVQASEPTHLFITEMTANELTIPDYERGLEAVKNRVVLKTGMNDLVFPQLIGFNEGGGNLKGGFQAYLKSYKKPAPVYISIFNGNDEATQVSKLSVEQFRDLGGEITLMGDLAFSEIS